MKKTVRMRQFFLGALVMGFLVISFLLIGTAYFYFWNPDKAHKMGVEADLEYIRTLLQLYKAENKKYPEGSSSDILNSLKFKPIDPWGNSYQVLIVKEKVIVFSFGKDGLPLTKDDISLVK